jgi:hypothetical protein
VAWEQSSRQPRSIEACCYRPGTNRPTCMHVVSCDELISECFFLIPLNCYCRRAGLVQAVESYRLWLEGPGFESRTPHIAQARVRLATDTLPQTPHRAGALCTGYTH